MKVISWGGWQKSKQPVSRYHNQSNKNLSWVMSNIINVNWKIIHVLTYALVFEYSKINKVSHWGSPFLKYHNGSNVCFSTGIPIP